MIELLQKFSLGKSEKIRGNTWFSSRGTYSEPAPTNCMIDSCRYVKHRKRAVDLDEGELRYLPGLVLFNG